MPLKVFLFLFFGFICLRMYAATDEESVKCFDEEHCKCTEHTVECNCIDGGNVTMAPFLKYLSSAVKVDNCHHVELKLGALSGSFLQVASFTNIDKLVIDSFGISGRSSVSKNIKSIFHFENISNLFIDTFGITALNQVRIFKMKNVTIEKLDSFAITGLDMTHFIIENSTILYLDTLAFHLTNILDFSMVDSYIMYALNISIVIKDSQSVVFNNCTFQNIISDSIFLPSVNSVNILKCTFDYLPGTVFWTRGHLFRFHQNSVQTRNEENAFQMVLSERIEFTNNSFQSVALNSILPNPYANISVENTIFVIFGNSFYCECPISWIFNDSEFYSTVIESSTCSNFPDLKLKQLVSFFERKEMCRHPVHDNINHRMLHIFPFAMDKIESKRLHSDTVIIIPSIVIILILLFVICLHDHSGT